MLNQFFGHFLLNKGMLTQGQLCAVLQSEQQIKVKLGILAVDAGLMTAAQVVRIHQLQLSKDKRFGELAIQEGYLTSQQVDRLLEFQQQGHLTLMQAIADNGYMTLAEVAAALADFRKEYDITENSLDIDTNNEVIKKMLDFAAAGDRAELLYDYVGLLLRNVVRFLNDTPFICAPITEGEQDHKWYASQQIIGDIALSTGMIMDEAVMLEIASRFYGEKLSEVDEMALGSIGEFLNVNNGVFGSSMSDNDLMTDLQAPVVKSGDINFYATNYRVAVGTSFGQFELILSFKK
ncbi:MAG: hypothetical protein H6Q74_3045 [Firmicutes bacterium]|nr:hypothetical protein [Bacillota bacterium]